MTASNHLDDKLLALRESFDRSFAEAPSEAREAELDFLAIRIAGDPYALRLSEIQSLHADKQLALAPSLLPELLGIAGFRGVLSPVYDFGALLGYAPALAPRWLVLARSASPIGFAFEAFDAHLRVSPSLVSTPDSGAQVLLRGAVQHGNCALPLLHLPSLVGAIAQRIKAHGPAQER